MAGGQAAYPPSPMGGPWAPLGGLGEARGASLAIALYRALRGRGRHLGPLGRGYANGV